jgi:hypothetical protein
MGVEIAYSCLIVAHKTPYKGYERKTNALLIAFIGYVNDLKFRDKAVAVWCIRRRYVLN